MRIELKNLDGNDPETRELIRTLLNENRCAVTFRKVSDGSIRTIDGTTDLFTIPEKFHPTKGGGTFPSTQAIFDFHVNGWRSFRWDSLIEVAIEPSPNASS